MDIALVEISIIIIYSLQYIMVSIIHRNVPKIKHCDHSRTQDKTTEEKKEKKKRKRKRDNGRVLTRVYQRERSAKSKVLETALHQDSTFFFLNSSFNVEREMVALLNFSSEAKISSSAQTPTANPAA
jgi:hypothetical protein